MADFRPTIGPALAAFGLSLPVTVTRPAPDNSPIPATGFWLPPMTDEQPFGTDFMRREPRRVFVIPRSALASGSREMPRGTIVEAPEIDGGESKRWQVDGLVHDADPDHLRVILKLVS